MITVLSTVKQTLCKLPYLPPPNMNLYRLQMCKFRIVKFIAIYFSSAYGKYQEIRSKCTVLVSLKNNSKHCCKLLFLQDFLSAFAVKSNCYLCKESKFEQMCRNIKDLHMWQILRKFDLNHCIYFTFVQKLVKNKYPNLPEFYPPVQI